MVGYQSVSWAVRPECSTKRMVNMNINDIKSEQLRFYRASKAGCAFAAVAAKDPARYGWIQIVTESNLDTINSEIQKAVNDSKTTTLSLIFPNVTTDKDLVLFVETLRVCPSIFFEHETMYEEFVCFGVRVKIGEIKSWVSGFGNYDFFPETRRTPYTEITFRVKPRPNYKWVMKKSPPDVTHLADLDMLGLTKATFIRLWNLSLHNTAKRLGHKPDFKSAAKTTYSIPSAIYESHR